MVITGSTRGIGYRLTEEFLKRSCRVVISGRKQVAVDDATACLAGQCGTEQVLANEKNGAVSPG